MRTSIRLGFAALCRETRNGLDVTQESLARTVGVSRSRISAIECGRADPSLGLVERIAEALGIELEIAVKPPVVLGTRQRDLVHARCSAYVQRRLEAAGLLCKREIEVSGGRVRGWIDLLAFDPRTEVLYVIEVKTVLHDIGGAERQLGWYTRTAWRVGASLGWQARRVRGWLLVLVTEDVDRSVRRNRDVLSLAFPTRAVAMRRELGGGGELDAGWGLALIDPSSRRRAWLQPTRLEGRRTQAPYRDYADAAARLGTVLGAKRAPAARASVTQGR